MTSPHGEDPYERFFRSRNDGTGDDGGTGGSHSDVPPGPDRGGSGAQPRLPTRKARRQRTVLTVTSMMSALVLLASGGAWAFSGYALDRVGRVNVFESLDERPTGGSTKAMNILLVGVDKRSSLSPEMRRKLNVGYAPGKRSDTMILAHISADHDRVSLVSLPRDSLVTIPEHKNDDGERVPARKAKLNASYNIGGAPLALATVEQATGVRIDHYIEVNFLGFIKIVNALGGVNVCLPYPVRDKKSGLTLPAGQHHVDGITALKYVRSRHGFKVESDLGRIERQQKFLASMMHRALSSGVLFDPQQFRRVLNAGLAAVQVDAKFSKSDMRTLATSMRSLSPKHVKFLTVPLASKAHTVPGVGSTVLWDDQKAGRLFGRIKHDKPISGPTKSGDSKPSKAGKSSSASKDEQGSQQTPVTIPPQRIAVDVFNTTNISGLGARARQDLLNAGFLAPQAARNAPPVGSKTVIEYGVNRAQSARTVHAAIPGSVMRKNPALGDGLRVLLGSSYNGVQQVSVDTGASQGQQKKIKAKSAAEIPCK